MGGAVKSGLRSLKASIFLLIGICTALNAQVAGYTVRFHTNLGDIDVNLTPDVTPATVANFLLYIARGTYTGTIFHRSVSGFVIQGGGYLLQNAAPVPASQLGPVKNEFSISNTRGTIAMAKLGSDPNSATNQWFFNLANNAGMLDSQNGGFTVFGRVAGDASLAVMDAIAALPVFNLTSSFGSAFDTLPLTNYTSGAAPVIANYARVSSIERLPLDATFANGASYQSSSSAGIAPGEVLTIFGTGIGAAQLTTLVIDSTGKVSTTLAGTRVLFDGTAAPILYTSKDQISVVAPYNVAGKSKTTITVTSPGILITPVTLNVATANPGIFTLDASGKGDAAIVRTDGSVVSTAAPAQAGDVLSLFGEGYGVASPALADGAIVGLTLPLPTAKTSLLIDGQTVDTLYAGGAPGITNGVLQVNFRVPTLSAGSHSIQVQVGDRLSPTGVNFQTK